MLSRPQRAEDLRLDGGIVVGDDGSPAAESAIRYALDEAGRRASPLHVVRAWTIPDAVRTADKPLGYVPSLEEFEAMTLEATRRRVRNLVGDRSDVTVEVHVVYGSAGPALVTVSRTTDVLVVGSRGLSGLVSVLLGSVAAHVIHHSAVPVIVVR